VYIFIIKLIHHLLNKNSNASKRYVSFPVTAETSQSTTSPDTVQCGCCRASYPLGEIVRFIEHKVNHCRSTLQGCHSPPATAAPEDSDPEDALTLKTADSDSKLNSVPSISAPINKRSGRLESPPTLQVPGPDTGSPIDLKASASSTPKRRTEAPDEDKEDLPKKQKTESVDADTNTVNSGKFLRLFFSRLLLRISFQVTNKYWSVLLEFRELIDLYRVVK